jgi:hypothetical protein
MADLYLFLAIHFTILMAVGGAVGYYFSRMYIENKIAEEEIKRCQYRTEHLNAERLLEIINR